MSYSSSLTDTEWEILEPLLPEVLPQKKKLVSWIEVIEPLLTAFSIASRMAMDFQIGRSDSTRLQAFKPASF